MTPEYLFIGLIIGSITSAIWFLNAPDDEPILTVALGVLLGAFGFIAWPFMLPAAGGYAIYAGLKK